jgi:predicted nucleotidyltransferase
MLAQVEKKDPLVKHLREIFRRRADSWGIQSAFLYGSRAHGFPRKDSDLDIAIAFDHEQMSDQKIFSVITTISLFLSKELCTDVNIIPIYRDFRKPLLYYNAIVKGIPFYVKDYSKFLALRKESIDQMEDYEIFGRDWQLVIARRNLEDLRHARI